MPKASLSELNTYLAKKKLQPITPLQFRFCVCYTKNSANGMKSIRDAGFKHSTPGSQSSAAHRLLGKAKIKWALNYLLKN